MRFEIPTPKQGQLYQLQFWIYLNEDRYGATEFELIELDNDNNRLQSKKFRAWGFNRILDPSGWVQVNEAFRLKGATGRCLLRYEQPELYDKSTWIDELLVRPEQTHLYQENEGWVWKNNLYFPKSQ